MNIPKVDTEQNFPNTYEGIFQSSYNEAAREFHPILELPESEQEARIREIQDGIIEEHRRLEIDTLKLKARKRALEEVEERQIPSVRRRLRERKDAGYKSVPASRPENKVAKKAQSDSDRLKALGIDPIAFFEILRMDQIERSRSSLVIQNGPVDSPSSKSDSDSAQKTESELTPIKRIPRPYNSPLNAPKRKFNLSFLTGIKVR